MSYIRRVKAFASSYMVLGWRCSIVRDTRVRPEAAQIESARAFLVGSLSSAAPQCEFSLLVPLWSQRQLVALDNARVHSNKGSITVGEFTLEFDGRAADFAVHQLRGHCSHRRRLRISQK